MSLHEHHNRCYWDHLEARWECRPELDEQPEQTTGFPAVVLSAEQPVTAAAAD